MRSVRSTGTGAEKKCEIALRSLKMRYRRHAAELPGRPDFIITASRVALFVHGCFWHAHKNCKNSAPSEYTVFKRVLDASKLKFVLNEKDIVATAEIKLPQSYRRRIVPSPIYEARQHRDIRIAQRAATIADLAKIIVERKVQKGLRRTLHFQAIRLEVLANERFHEVGGAVEVETGDDS
jgi:hypothetical protein